jgi:hypothetical protein
MANRRFDGAITTPADSGEIGDQTVIPTPERPRRPLLLEGSSAVLIVGGLTSILGTIGYQVGGGDTGALGLLILALDILTIMVGVLIRMGRAWVFAINVVAIALFLELTALPSAFAIVFVVLDSIVLFALFRHRGWFYWQPPDVVSAADEPELGA